MSREERRSGLSQEGLTADWWCGKQKSRHKFPAMHKHWYNVVGWKEHGTMSTVRNTLMNVALSPCTLTPQENKMRVVGNERVFNIGMIKDDNPSATAHRKAVGAVHTYAVEEN